MRFWRALVVRAGSLVLRRRRDRELAEELQAHVEHEVGHRVARGESPEGARREARQLFGSVASTEDACRDAWGIGALDRLRRDVHHAVRRLVRDWRFATAGVLILALGIGANTAIFSVVNAALFKPSPYRESARLVNIYQNSARDGQASANSYPAVQDMVAYDDVFESVSASSISLSASYRVDDAVQSGLVEFATASHLRVLGLTPTLGRWFGGDEDRPGAPAVAVIGYEAWASQFDASPSVIGRTIRVEGVPVTIVGVAPPMLHSGQVQGLVVDFFLPISAVPVLGIMGPTALERAPTEAAFLAKARLRDGADLADAQAAMTALGARLARDYPDEDPGRGITVLAADDVRVHPQIDMLLVPGASLLLTLVGLVLAIACGNLATLLLVRGSSRAKEVSVRLALGATRRQLVGHLLTESVLLAASGGAVGCLLSVWGIRVLSQLDLPVVMDLRLDYRVLGFTLVLSLLTGVAVGLTPALRATRVNLVPELRDETDTLSARRRWFTLKNALVVGQVAASCVLLMASGLFLRALVAAQQADLGFEVDRLAFIETDARYVGYDVGEARAIHDTVRARIAALPGVVSTTLASGPPIGGFIGYRNIEVEGYESAEGEIPGTQWAWAGPQYFETLGIPVLYGRTFNAFDRPESPAVTVVNEAMARRYFGTPNAVGRRFRLADRQGGDFPGGAELEIIGVVPAVRTSVLEPPEPRIYRSFSQFETAMPTVIVRTTRDPRGVLQIMQRAVREVDAGLPVIALSTMTQRVEDSLLMPRSAGGFLGALGALGLALASVGLYAVVGFAVSRRSLEIGIRSALGAPRGRVVWELSRDVAQLLTVGVSAGMGLAWAGIQVLNAVFVSLSQAPNLEIGRVPVDALTFFLVVVTMLAVGLIAICLPAQRAATADPLVALRHL